MSEPPRSVYRLARQATLDQPLPDGLRLRTVTDVDDGALATLMERAYAGTIDEQLGGNSDGAIEMADWRAATPLALVSVVVVDADDHVVAASLCSGSWDGEVWISYVITDPAWKGQRLGTAAVVESVRQLRERAEVEILAGVTDGNTPSERLLATVGFERVGTVGSGNDPDRGHKQWLAGVFDRAAPTYDRVGDSYHDRFGGRLVTSAGVGVGARVLDVACGRGAVLVPAAKRVGDTGSVVGVDLSPAMVREARNTVGAAGLDARVDVRTMDAERLELTPDSFDFVLCSFGLVFFPQPAQAVREFVRVVAPGGVVGVSSWAEDDERWAWDDDLLAGLEVRRRAVAHPFDQPAEIADLLTDGGLDDVHTHLEHDDVVFASEAAWWEWKWSYSIRGVLEQVDDATRESYRRAAFAAMQQLRQPEGFPMRLTAIFALGHKPNAGT